MPVRKPPASGKAGRWAAATGKRCRPSDFLPYPLVHLARYQQDAHGTGGGGDEYRQPTVGNQIQIADDGDARLSVDSASPLLLSARTSLKISAIL